MIVDYEDYPNVRNKLMREGKWEELHNLKISPESLKLQALKEQISLCEFNAAYHANTGGFLGTMAGS